MNASEMLLKSIRPMSPELADLDFLKDKVAKGLYLREDEIRALKILARKYNGSRLTTNHILNVRNKAKAGIKIYI